MDNLSGQTLKGYELKELIGQGGFGAVYRAYQTLVKREVAVKIILPQYANHPDFIRNFEAEAQLIARLEHLHIVPLYDYWREPDGAYLVMRWLRGGSLQSSLRQGAWSVENATRLLDQMAAALTVAHRNNVIHRDIKPGNILLDQEGNAYLTDFGIAKNLESGDGVEEKGAVVGSPAYMSPEQIRSEDISPQTDIYSLGVVMYEVLTGEQPYGPNLTSSELIFKHLGEPLPELRKFRADIPAGLDLVIEKATAKRPDERYTDTIEFAKEFRRAVNLTAAFGGFGAATDVVTTETGSPLFTIKGAGTGHITIDAEALGIAMPEPENPYKGLRAFQEADAADFFGRSKLIERLQNRLTEDHPMARFLAVIGPSGSGKSSVIKAGVLPSMRRGALPGSDRWFYVEMVPGIHPVGKLAQALLSVAIDAPPGLPRQLRENDRGLVQAVNRILPDDNSELVLIIDQFEETFTQAEDEQERDHFLKSLLVATTDPESRLRVIVTLRADFYDRPLLFPEFGNLMRERTEVVLPLGAAELEEAIVGPAHRVGMTVDEKLIAAVVGDVSGEAGALPLLQYALTEVFERRKGRTLSIEAYQESGGALGALARRAEDLYNEMNADQQATVRQLFLRMVTLGEGTEDTRRRVRWAELFSIAADQDRMQTVMDTFTRYRLLTTDADPATREPTITVAHEALIRKWDRLRAWLDDSREDLLLQRRLSQSTDEWLNAKRDRSFLASGVRLGQFEQLVGEGDIALSQEEREFVKASVTEREVQAAEEEARKAKELELKRRSRNRSIAATVAAGVALMGIILTAIALYQRAEAQEARADAEDNAATATIAQGQAEYNAATAVVAQGQAEANEQQAKSLSLAYYSQQALQANSVNTAIALGLEAVAIPSPSALAENALFDAAVAPGTRHFLTDDVTLSTVISPDGLYGLSGGGNPFGDPVENTPVKYWNLQTGEVIHSLTGHTAAAVWEVAFNADGTQALSCDTNGVIILWNLADGTEIKRFQAGVEWVLTCAFTPDGKGFVSGGGPNLNADISDPDISELALWDINSGEIVRRFEGHSKSVWDAEISPDGKTLLSTSADPFGIGGTVDNSVRWWNLETGEELHLFTNELTGFLSVTFTPDGTAALAGLSGGDPVVMYYTLEDGTERRFEQIHTDAVWIVSVASDGRTALSGGGDNLMVLWNVETGKPIRIFTGHGSAVLGAAISPDGRTGFSTGSFDATLRIWDLANGAEVQRYSAVAGQTAPTSVFAINPTQTQALTGATDGSVALWDITTDGHLIYQLLGQTTEIRSVAISPDGKLGAAGAINNTDAGEENADILVWDLATGEEVYRLVGHTREVNALTFSADSAYLYSGGGDDDLAKRVRVWNMATGQEEAIIFGEQPEKIMSVALTPDGTTLAIGNGAGEIKLLNPATGELMDITFANGHTNLVTSLMFNADGTRLLSGSADNNLILWDVTTGERLKDFRGHTGAVNRAILSSNGEHILSSASDGSIRLWEVASGQQTRLYRGHEGMVAAAFFLADGQTFISAGGDRTMRVWLTLGLLDELLQWVEINRDVTPLTDEERQRYGLPVETAASSDGTPMPSTN